MTHLDKGKGFTHFEGDECQSLRTQIEQAISFAIQGTVEYNHKSMEDYYHNRSKWIAVEADQILTAIRVELEAKLPKEVEEYPNDGQAQYGQRVGYNRAIREVKLIIKEML